MPKFIDLINRQFGKLTVISKADIKTLNRGVVWLCHCECGNKEFYTRTSYLINDLTVSCGCYRRKRTEFSDIIKKKLLYERWKSIKKRCLNENSQSYHLYGGRGIKICDRWKESFEAFVADMGEPPEGHEIDRINNNGNYEPNNCRWVLGKINQNNRRNNHRIAVNGIELNIGQWAYIFGIHKATFSARIKRCIVPEEQYISDLIKRVKINV